MYTFIAFFLFTASVNACTLELEQQLFEKRSAMKAISKSVLEDIQALQEVLSLRPRFSERVKSILYLSPNYRSPKITKRTAILKQSIKTKMVKYNFLRDDQLLIIKNISACYKRKLKYSSDSGKIYLNFFTTPRGETLVLSTKSGQILEAAKAIEKPQLHNANTESHAPSGTRTPAQPAKQKYQALPVLQQAAEKLKHYSSKPQSPTHAKLHDSASALSGISTPIPDSPRANRHTQHAAPSHQNTNRYDSDLDSIPSNGNNRDHYDQDTPVYSPW
nr:hypothetical protein [Whitefly negevirus 1]